MSMRAAVLFAVLLACSLSVRGAAVVADGAESGPVSLSLTVARADGPPVMLQFMMRAESVSAAEAAARAAAQALFPSGQIIEVDSGHATAQYVFWSWKWDDAELPVVVAYNPAGAIPGFGPQSIVAALAAWSAVEGSKFAFIYGGITERKASLHDQIPDGENVIEWRELPCTPAACALGLTSKEVTHEVDLVLNSNPEARLGDGLAGSPVDAGTVALHEIGHIAGLEHSCPPLIGPCTTDELNAVMYFQYVGVHRVLGSDDRAGIVALYPVPQAPPGHGRVVTLAPGWNLALLPNGKAGEVMAPLTCARAAYGWTGDGWHVWLRGVFPSLQTLTDIDQGAGYWLWADGACEHFFP